MDPGLAVTIAVGAVLVALGLPLRSGRVRRNGWYGFRTPTTLRDDGAWYRANTVFGRAMVVAASLTGIAAAILTRLGYTADDDAVVLALVAIVSLPLFVGLVIGFVVA